jgi:hypothetical protein
VPTTSERTTSTRSTPSWLPELIAALLGLAWFIAIGGWRTLDPNDLSWLEGDQRQHALGWLFFRESPWRLPIGRISGFAWPEGTTVGYTDANPIVAVALKPWSALLPRDFHYVGLWLAACFALQGWFGARVARLAGVGGAYRVAAGALFGLAPVLTFRVAHDTLCAHFALLFLLALLLRPAADAAEARRAITAATWTAVLLTVVHPTLAAMAIVLVFALCVRVVRVERLLPRRDAWRRAGVALLAKGVALLAFGYITTAPAHFWGFGRFSADPLAWVNPLDRSRFLPALPLGTGQYEGYLYLGAGGIVLLVVVGVATLFRPPPRLSVRLVMPALVACALLFLFALSNVIRVLGHTLVDLRWLYKPIYGVVGAYRSSGRFAWPLYYLVLALAIVALPRLLGSGRRATAALAAIVALQFVDVSVAVGQCFRHAEWRLAAPEWALMAGDYRHLALVPPQIVGVGGACHIEEAYAHDYGYYQPFAYEAYRNGLTVNSALLSRGSTRRMEPHCRALLDEFRAGVLRDDTVYVVSAAEKGALARHPGAARCGRLDGHMVCVSSTRATALSSALAASSGR